MEAFKIIDALMVGAEKDSVRLAAAIAILKLAGVNFDRADVPDAPTLPPPQSYSRDALMAAAMKDN
jgi:hypothetical protein